MSVEHPEVPFEDPTLPVIGWADLADRRGTYGGCTVIDGVVIDIEAFLTKHPGGQAVLRAHLGRDATADFHHVPAHDRPVIDKLRGRMAVARIRDTEPDDPAAREWRVMLGDLLLVRNSTDLLLAVPREPLTMLVYLGQSYVHLVVYHLSAFRSRLRALAGMPVIEEYPDAEAVAEAFRDCVQRTLDAAATETASSAVDAITGSVSGLLTELITLAARGSEDGSATDAAAALRDIEIWLGAERRRWSGTPDRSERRSDITATVTGPLAAYLAAAPMMPVNVDGTLSMSTGFLPERLHVTPLPGEHRAWEQAADRLPELAYSGRAQAALEELPPLSADADHLPDDQLPWCATLLGMLAHAYWRFGLDNLYQPRNAEISAYLPEVIRLPWEEVNRRLGRAFTGFTLEDQTFNNFTFLDESLIGPNGEYLLEDVRAEGMRLRVAGYGNNTERIFLCVIPEMHAAVAPAVRAMPELEALLATPDPTHVPAVARFLELMCGSVRAATAAFRKIDPNPRSATHCDPVEWAKTLGAFAVPAPGYPVGPSGSAAPFVHFLDALIGRQDYSSELGAFAAMLRGSQLPRKQQLFCDLVAGMDLRGWVTGLRDTAPSAFTEAAEAFNGLVDNFAGPGGFLGVHKAKVVDFLSVGTLVGRNQSTAHHQTYVAEQSWTMMAQRLHVTMGERGVRGIR